MTDAPAETLRRQLEFLAELDALKSVLRQSPLANRSRRENSAEHSWHLAMFALVLAEHAAEPIDPGPVVALLLLHDIVEIDAGDAPIHATANDGTAPDRASLARASLARAEQAAAERLFGLLPADQGARFLALWQEFEAAATPEARFARALDRLQPLLLNTLAGGGTWTENGVTEAQVAERYGPAIRGGSPRLWQAAAALVRRHFAATSGSEA